LSNQQERKNIEKLCSGILLGLLTSLPVALAQVPAPSGFNAVPPHLRAASRSPLITLTLLDALERAQRLDPQYQSAVSNTELARENRLQTRAAPLPTLGLSSQYLNTHGNGAITGWRSPIFRLSLEAFDAEND
jgi:outer membrane protein TolC